MPIDKAIIACKSLGAGWRLPTLDELRRMHFQLNIDAKGNFETGDYYWSEFRNYNNEYYIFSFQNGMHYTERNISTSYFVRAVREK